MPALSIPAGQKFARLTIIEIGVSVVDKFGWKRSTSLCRCDCGTLVTAINKHIKSGHTKSCGCIAAEVLKRRNFKHGHATRGGKHPLYFTWEKMHARCRNKNDQDFYLYGARGIMVCDRWKLFENFLHDMGNRPRTYSIDRIDTNGNYEPANCRWADAKTQARNQRTNRIVQLDGIRACVAEHAERLGVRAKMVNERLREGWPPEIAFKAPKGSSLKRLLAT